MADGSMDANGRQRLGGQSDAASLILHDLQRDLVQKRREKNLAELHLRLVQARDLLPKLPDAYAWRWVGYHMVNAGRKAPLESLGSTKMPG
jgi:hypothetical protein